MTTPLSSPSPDTANAAPPSADDYEKLVTSPPAPALRFKHLLLAATLVVAGGEFLHVRHIRAEDALRAAVMEHDNAQVRDLLRGGSDPNLRYVSVLDAPPGLWRYLPGWQGSKVSNKNRTVLIAAAHAGSADIVQTLLAYGANPNITLANGQTALLAALTTRDVLTPNLLLSKGADFRVHDREGNSPLHLAAQTGNTNALTALLDVGADIEEKDAQGQTALCLACANRHEDAIKLLLARGAELNALEAPPVNRFDTGQSNGLRFAQSMMQHQRIPLVWAAQQGSAALISALWDKHLDANTRELLGSAALTGAVQSGSTEAVQALLDRGVPVEPPAVSNSPRQSPVVSYYTSPLMTAAGMHNVALCRLLLERGANVNRSADPRYGATTPLIAAATATDGAIVELLLAHGADVKAHNADGTTALMAACNSPAATRVLLAHGADVNARDKRDNTALMHSQNNEVLELLLEAGADAHGGSQDTMLLARATTPEVVSLLIAQGAKVDERDSQGQTTLMRTYNDDLVAALLEHGADVNARDNQGRTALHHAVTRLSEKRIALLVAHGADVNAASSNGETPLALAKKTRFPPLIDALVKAGATK